MSSVKIFPELEQRCLRLCSPTEYRSSRRKQGLRRNGANGLGWTGRDVKAKETMEWLMRYWLGGYKPVGAP